MRSRIRILSLQKILVKIVTERGLIFAPIFFNNFYIPLQNCVKCVFHFLQIAQFFFSFLFLSLPSLWVQNKKVHIIYLMELNFSECNDPARPPMKGCNTKFLHWKLRRIVENIYFRIFTFLLIITDSSIVITEISINCSWNPVSIVLRNRVLTWFSPLTTLELGPLSQT